MLEYSLRLLIQSIALCNLRLWMWACPSRGIGIFCWHHRRGLANTMCKRLSHLQLPTFSVLVCRKKSLRPLSSRNGPLGMAQLQISQDGRLVSVFPRGLIGLIQHRSTTSLVSENSMGVDLRCSQSSRYLSTPFSTPPAGTLIQSTCWPHRPRVITPCARSGHPSQLPAPLNTTPVSVGERWTRIAKILRIVWLTASPLPMPRMALFLKIGPPSQLYGQHLWAWTRA